MSIIAPKDTPVWVDERRCKACNICVSYCPAGVLAMRDEKSAVLGQMVEVVNPSSCIGCSECEVHCPDFAIMVATRSEFKFAKLTPEAKQRAEAIKQNKYKKVGV
ncbi:4Fe-4S binding protein [uncultured Campylobacter sp.]|uniref:4Fe-4S dicluster domain-containing protein n=1 Tax=uncultured Campylobacter sp. TaxID=218934 RepID=UPI0026339F3A|nr:4Fe-4S binding protein [uncultured Campylobacter sp.]